MPGVHLTAPPRPPAPGAHVVRDVEIPAREGTPARMSAGRSPVASAAPVCAPAMSSRSQSRASESRQILWPGSPRPSARANG